MFAEPCQTMPRRLSRNFDLDSLVIPQQVPRKRRTSNPLLADTYSPLFHGEAPHFRDDNLLLPPSYDFLLDDLDLTYGEPSLDESAGLAPQQFYPASGQQQVCDPSPPPPASPFEAMVEATGVDQLIESTSRRLQSFCIVCAHDRIRAPVEAHALVRHAVRLFFAGQVREFADLCDSNISIVVRSQCGRMNADVRGIYQMLFALEQVLQKCSLRNISLDDFVCVGDTVHFNVHWTVDVADSTPKSFSSAECWIIKDGTIVAMHRNIRRHGSKEDHLNFQADDFGQLPKSKNFAAPAPAPAVDLDYSPFYQPEQRVCKVEPAATLKPIKKEAPASASTTKRKRACKTSATDDQKPPQQGTKDAAPVKRKRRRRSNKAAWHEKFQLLLEFKEQYGHVRVPQNIRCEKFRGLGVWINNKRAAYRNEILLRKGIKPKSAARISPEQIKQLESIGFQWGRCIASAAWDKKFKNLTKYREIHGNSRPPASLNTEEYPGLGKWVVNQRQAYRFELMRRAGQKPHRRANRISEKQIKLLESIDFQWVVGRRPRR